MMTLYVSPMPPVCRSLCPVYTSRAKQLPVRASHNTDNLMPHLMGFMGMYCFQRGRPLYLIIASSIDWATPGLKGRGRVLLQGYQEWPNLAQLVCTFFSRWICRRQTLLSSFVSAVHLLLSLHNKAQQCTCLTIGNLNIKPIFVNSISMVYSNNCFPLHHTLYLSSSLIVLKSMLSEQLFSLTLYPIS